MEALIKDYAEVLLKDHEPPCLSVYQPTHRSFPENQQDAIRFKNLIRELRTALAARQPDTDADALLGPFERLLEDRDFWIHSLDGLAVLGAAGVFRVYRLQRSVPEIAVVADSFHTKPLIRILQSVDRYQVLALTRKHIRLFEGNRDALDEVALAEGVPRTITDALGEQLTEPYLTGSAHRQGAGGDAIFHGHGSKKDEVDVDAERFFRSVDKAVYQHHSSISKLPLVLAALPQHQALFRSVTGNPMLADAHVDVDPDALDMQALRERAWQAVEPQYRARVESLIEQFSGARARGLGADELPNIAQAVIEGRVATLLVDADRHVGGRIDGMGRIHDADIASPDADDVLDDLGEMVLRRGGQTLVLPADRMPTKNGVAAIYRY